MFVADEGVAAVMGVCPSPPRALTPTLSRPSGRGGMFVADGCTPMMGCDGGVVVWLVCPSAPGPHPNPLPSNGRGGMFVADECVAAVMGVLVVWLVGRPRGSSLPSTGLDRWTGMGDAVVGLVGVRPRSAPGPHPNPLPSKRERGMFVADECTPMMGMWLFGWRAPPSPGPHPNPLPSNGRGGMFVVDEGVAAVMGGWWFGW